MSTRDKQWKLKSEVIDALNQKGINWTEIRMGESPYSPFDIVCWEDDDAVIGQTPMGYKISDIELKSADPATAYKGRHGRGRMILATPAEDGLVKVPSYRDDIELELVDGTTLGRDQATTIGDMFPDLGI